MFDYEDRGFHPRQEAAVPPGLRGLAAAPAGLGGCPIIKTGGFTPRQEAAVPPGLRDLTATPAGLLAIWFYGPGYHPRQRAVALPQRR